MTTDELTDEIIESMDKLKNDKTNFRAAEALSIESSRAQIDVFQSEIDGLQLRLEEYASQGYTGTEGHENFLKKIIRRVIRKMTAWLFLPYYSANNRLVSLLSIQIDVLADNLDEKQENLDKIQEGFEQLQSSLNQTKLFQKNLEISLKTSMEELSYSVQKELEQNSAQFQTQAAAMNQELSTINSNLLYYNWKLNRPQNSSKIQPTHTKNIQDISIEETSISEEINPYTLQNDWDINYFILENRMRGPIDVIKERFQKYVHFFEGKENIMDFGCGRGEFLLLMQENNISAFGVDLCKEFVEYGTDKGLDMRHGNALAVLESLPDDSLGGLFAGQVIEHLTADEIYQLLYLAQKKLKHGAYIVLETPNPASLAIFWSSFYMDLTHIRPIHPELMKFLFQYYGFSNVEFKLSSPLENRLPELPEDGRQIVQQTNEAVRKLNDLLYGNQDYTVYGQK